MGWDRNSFRYFSVRLHEKGISRGKSKSAAPTWGRAGALAGVKLIQTNAYPEYPRCSFEGNKILAWMWRDVAGPNQTPVSHRLFYHDLSICHYRIWTVLIDSMGFLVLTGAGWRTLYSTKSVRPQGALGFSLLRRPVQEIMFRTRIFEALKFGEISRF